MDDAIAQMNALMVEVDRPSSPLSKFTDHLETSYDSSPYAPPELEPSYTPDFSPEPDPPPRGGIEVTSDMMDDFMNDLIDAEAMDQLLTDGL